ncbi:asparaginase [Polynucleobacter kasalickyi]|uniref:L-asparaginase n=1 Tax=Polynucleobacter kasalickyi TaxID=1938817 RepID=A0A1W1Y6H3_9BURK|nr:asparaginase domain-containing protein [Polynucleobacter kasalickyi]SMC31810.1 L-asparaginase [Polynucleobacter kasalickyi]
MKNILIIGMGGTIAGIAPDPEVDPLNYAAGQVGVADLLKNSLPPQLSGLVHLKTLQLANINSGDLTEDLLSKLGQTVGDALRQRQYDGIVITHGTDTIEETGIFLHLAFSRLASRLGKAVVLTGAMLPSNVSGADGPQNLSNAVELAAFLGVSFQPKLRLSGGVYGTFAGKVIFAKDYLKRSSNQMNAPVMDSLDLSANPSMLPPKSTEFALNFPKSGEAWPWVEILTSHAGVRPDVFKFLLKQGVEGVVLAGTGQGNVHENLMESLLLAKGQQLPMVRASRTLLGDIRPEVPVSDQSLGTVAARNLSPAKARVALQLFIYSQGAQKDFDLRHLFDTI